MHYFPDERLGGVEREEFTLSCKRAMSYSVTWKGNAISAECLGFLGVFFVCFVLLFLLLVFFSPFPLKPLESLECVFVKAATCRGLNSSFSSVLLLANSPQLASAFSLDESLTLYTWAEEGSAGPFWGLVQGQIHQHQSLLFLQFVSKYSLH